MRPCAAVSVFAAAIVAAASSNACDRASVYIYRNSHEQHSSFRDSAAPSLDLQQNQLVLADVAGTSRMHKFSNEADARLVHKIVGHRSIFGNRQESGIIVLVDGVRSEEKLIDDEPTYYIDASPDASYFADMFNEIADHSAKLVGKARYVLTSGLEVISKNHQIRQLIDSSLFENSEFSQELVEDIVRLRSIELNVGEHHNDVALVHLTSLLKLDGDAYEQAADTLREYIQELLKREQHKVAVVAIPRNTCHYSVPISKREESFQPLALSSGVYATKAKCESETSSCSGHGTCSQLARGGFACTCKPSYDEAKKKTTRWGGNACQKKDVSIETQMFLWTTIAFVALGIYGVRLLVSIGSDPLPGVLTASTASHKKQ